MRADQARDHPRLGLAQLRELLGDVRHRAVMLAQLPAGGDRRRAGRIALRRQGAGERFGPRQRIVTGIPGRGAAPLFERAHQLMRERGHRGVAVVASDPPQRSCGQIVIGVRATPHPPGIGEREDLGRASPPALPVHVLFARDHLAVGEHGVEVTPDRGRAQPDRLPQLGRCGRAVLQ